MSQMTGMKKIQGNCLSNHSIKSNDALAIKLLISLTSAMLSPFADSISQLYAINVKFHMLIFRQMASVVLHFANAIAYVIVETLSSEAPEIAISPENIQFSV